MLSQIVFATFVHVTDTGLRGRLPLERAVLCWIQVSGQGLRVSGQGVRDVGQDELRIQGKDLEAGLHLL
ncbi:MAG: hypothetical protein R3B93_20120 [Bacteroidia bacterium]